MFPFERFLLKNLQLYLKAKKNNSNHLNKNIIIILKKKSIFIFFNVYFFVDLIAFPDFE